MSIQKELDQIKNAVYGKEVRGAIHDGIKKAYDDASKNGNANMEVELARGEYPTLNGRLENLDQETFSLNQQLAETDRSVTENYNSLTVFSKKIGELGSTSVFKGSDTYSGIISKTGVLIGDEWYDITNNQSMRWNGSAWAIVGNTIKLGENSVDDKNVSFIKKSTNVIPMDNLLYDQVPTTTGIIEKNGFITTEYYLLKANEKLTFSNIDSWYAYDKSKNYLFSGTGNLGAAGSDRYIRIVFLEKYYDSVQVNVGAVLLPYEKPFGLKIDKFVHSESIKDKSILKKHLNDNIVDDKKIQKNAVTSSKATNIISSPVIIFGNNPVIFDLEGKIFTVPPASLLAFRNVRYQLPQGTYDFLNDGSLYQAVFYNPTRNVFEVKGSGSLLGESSTSQENIMMGIADFRNQKVFFNGNIRINGSEFSGGSLLKKPYVFASKEIVGNYFPVTKIRLDEAGLDGLLHDTITTNKIHELYDDLVIKYPNVFKKTVRGKDASGLFNVNQYDLTPELPPSISGKSFTPYPTILITCGVHGDGPMGDKHEMLVALYYFFKDILDNWKNNEILTYLRFNVNFKIIPVVNPWGIDNKSRKNSNAVDINRNADFNHIILPDKTRVDYGGEAPWSEVESQYVRDLVMENKNAIAYTDLHTTRGNPEQSKMIYASIHPDSELIYPARTVITDLSIRWDKRSISGLVEGNHGYIVDYDKQADLCSWSTKVANVPAGVLEAFPNFVGSEVPSHGEKIMEMAHEEIGQWIWTILKHFKSQK